MYTIGNAIKQVEDVMPFYEKYREDEFGSSMVYGYS